MSDSKPSNGKVSLQALDAEMASRVDRANAYHKSFHASAEQVAVYAFLAGVQLNAIKETVKHGQFMAFRENFLPEIPHRSATRYMSFADQIGHVANLPAMGNVKLLSNGRLPEKEEAKLLTAFREQATGKTLTELYRDTGIIREKKDVGRKPGELPKKLSLSEQAELRREQATQDWVDIDRGLFVYADKFTLLGDDDVTAQIARLEQALSARRGWLKQPQNRRDPKAIEALFRS